MTRPRLLLIDDSEAFRGALGRALGRSYEIVSAASAEEARKRFNARPDAVLLDLRLDEDDPSNAASLALLGEIRQALPATAVIMITAYGDVASAVECMRLGAADFIQKTSDLKELKARIDKALEQARMASRLRQLEEELAVVEPRRLVGESAAMREVKEMIAAVARDGQVTVLITGETGTGKELVARAIHASGSRADGPFVAVAIAALPPTTAASELFGHERGAFTDARERHEGFAERAHGGVLFLDEIGELAPDLQVKLLRFLEERTITRLGGRSEIDIDAQVITATNADLSALIAEGRFREDLYYRLKVCEIRLPPLRDRREDIEPLVTHYLAVLGAPARGITGLSPAALEQFRAYHWPGNVRELRNALEAALLKASLHRRTVVELDDLPAEMTAQAAPARATGASSDRPPGPAATPPPGRAADAPRPLDEALAEAELAEVERALAATGGKKTEAWKLLGLNDRYVFTRRVKRLCERYPALLARFPQVRDAFLRSAPVGDEASR